MHVQQTEGTTERGQDDAPIVMRARGKSFGRLDPKTLRWSMKRGGVEVTFDLRESVRVGRPVTIDKVTR